MAGSSGIITADSGALETGYADFGRTLTALVNALRELDGQLTTSLAEWSGSARQAYDTAHAEWWQSAAELAGTLAWLRGVLSVAQVNYGRCEDSVTRAFTEG
ncbi:MAG: WXG100 family type VII secretion target [Nocardiopsaceae bacterium]|nr:WXG100 family type VII secretion target [Nocardiopsaceae bacterium]